MPVNRRLIAHQVISEAGCFGFRSVSRDVNTADGTHWSNSLSIDDVTCHCKSWGVIR